MNKLRRFVVAAVAVLVALCGWVVLRYGLTPASTPGLLQALVVALLLPVVPVALTHGKSWGQQLFDAHRNGAGMSFERRSIFVSADAVGDSDETLSDIEAAVAGADEYDDCRRDQFDEGRGLTVRHTGFHNSFVRVAGDGRLVVTGASANTHALASLVERVASLTMEKTRRHPLFEPTPIRGAPRAFLGVFLVVLFCVGAAGGLAAAYPAGVYSAPERAVLVGLDARAAAVPGYDDADAALDKSAFLVDSLSEEAVELGWERDDVDRLSVHARQAVVLSSTVDGMVTSARDDGLSQVERERAASIDADRHAAECRVADTISTRIEKGRVEGDPKPLERARSTLRSRAAAAGAPCEG